QGVHLPERRVRGQRAEAEVVACHRRPYGAYVDGQQAERDADEDEQQGEHASPVPAQHTHATGRLSLSPGGAGLRESDHAAAAAPARDENAPSSKRGRVSLAPASPPKVGPGSPTAPRIVAF